MDRQQLPKFLAGAALVAVLGVLVYRARTDREPDNLHPGRSTPPVHLKPADKPSVVENEPEQKNLSRSPAEVACRKWIAQALDPSQRKKALDEQQDLRRKDPLYGDVQLQERFIHEMVGEDGRSGLIERSVRRFGDNSPPVRQLRAYFEAHRLVGGKWDGGKKPSLKLIKVIDTELSSFETLLLVSRGSRRDPGLKKRVAEARRRLLDSGSSNIADAIAGHRLPASEQSALRQAQNLADLGAILDDPEARSRLGLLAAACIRFRDLQSPPRGSGEAARKARQTEEAMTHWARASDAERRGLQEAGEQEKFFDRPQQWMDDFLARHPQKDTIRCEREVNTKRHEALCKRCPRLFPLGDPGKR